MAVRVTSEEVAEIVEVETGLSLTPFITMANNLTDRVDTCDTDNILSTATLTSIELLLSAHFYSLRDQQYTSKKTGDASGTFRGDSGMGLEATTYGQNAIAMDFTGCLAEINEQMKAGKRKIKVEWLGKPKSDQLNYVDRD